jgi:hypothetical protein
MRILEIKTPTQRREKVTIGKEPPQERSLERTRIKKNPRILKTDNKNLGREKQNTISPKLQLLQIIIRQAFRYHIVDLSPIAYASTVSHNLKYVKRIVGEEAIFGWFFMAKVGVKIACVFGFLAI